MINYTWEVTRRAGDKEDNKEDKGDKEDKEDKEEKKEEECREIIIIRKPCDKKDKKRVVKMPSRDDIWPRRMRTDITEHYH